MTAWSPQVEVCLPELRTSALEVLYRRVPESLRERLISEVLHEAACGQVDLSGLWVARRPPWSFGSRSGSGAPAGRIIGALLTQLLAGRAAAIWTPEVEPSLLRTITAAALVRAALADLKARGIRIVQAVLDESASRRGAKDLIKGGMPRITELLYLERDTKIPLPPETIENREASAARSGTTNVRPGMAETDIIPRAHPPELIWRSFDPAHEAEFRALLQATYASSLDMPELEGVRSLDDVIEGHRATGRFIPARWRLGQVPGHPEIAVVLLLSAVPDRDVWEVVYLGLTPAARGRGLGRAAIAHALELARRHVSRLELAVDIRNVPATRLYESTGFTLFDRRSVHLVVFPEKG